MALARPTPRQPWLRRGQQAVHLSPSLQRCFTDEELGPGSPEKAKVMAGGEARARSQPRGQAHSHRGGPLMGSPQTSTFMPPILKAAPGTKEASPEPRWGPADCLPCHVRQAPGCTGKELPARTAHWMRAEVREHRSK